MSTDTNTHDVAVATDKATSGTPKPPETPRPETKPNVETETAPKQVQPEGR